MAIGYDYRCAQCLHEWTLFSKWFTLGPVQWGETKYTCFSCQSFLSIAECVDASSWSIWYRNHQSDCERNATLSHLAEMVRQRLATKRGFAPIELHFDSIECPTCHDAMSVIPFGQHLMKCPKCGEFTGEFDSSRGISIYGFIDDGEENAT
jgi:ribosomal protein S27E